MRPALIAACSALVLFAGCLGDPSTASHQDSASSPIDLVIGPEALSDAKGSLRVIVVAEVDTWVEVTFTNGQLDDGFYPAYQDCGELQILRLDGAVGDTLRSKRWGETGGHALVASTAVVNQSVSLDRATDDYGIADRIDLTLRVALVAGQRVVVDLGMRDPASPRYSPSLNLTSGEGALLESVQPYAFRCGAGFSDFQGTFAWSGLPPAPIFMASDASLRLHPASRNVTFDFALKYFEFTTGYCKSTLAVDGVERAGSEGMDVPCQLHYVGPAGDLSVILAASASAAPEVRYFLRGEP